jgi:purine-binding chemotaxis protein CheW
MKHSAQPQQPDKASAPKTIDWDSIRQHLQQAGVALQGLDENTPENMEPIWAQRAARLARVPVRTDDSEQLAIVLLRLGREIYGVEAQYVFDIRPVEKMTRVPRVPAWVAGVVNSRGRIYSVIDLERLLGLEDGAGEVKAPAAPAEGAAARSLVMVTTPEMEVALLVDEVLPMSGVAVNKIQEATGTVRQIRTEFMRGIADRADGGSMVILDLPVLLADKQLIVQEEVV